MALIVRSMCWPNNVLQYYFLGDTTYQELETTQMNQEDNYTPLHANVHDAIYEELDTKQMKKESDGYESLGMKGKSNEELVYVMTY